MTWLIFAIVVVLVAGAVVVWQRRSAALKDRFGPEYERLVEERGDRRTAEAELRERAKRHDALELHDLTPEARHGYTERWQAVQAGFVDDPTGTVVAADALVSQVMRDRGYPVDEWEERFEMVSVDHPELAENYRVAHAIHERGTGGEVDIDDQREAFQRYRSLFDELLADGVAVVDDEDDEAVDGDDAVGEADAVEPVADDDEGIDEARATRGERP